MQVHRQALSVPYSNCAALPARKVRVQQIVPGVVCLAAFGFVCAIVFGAL
ncbi:hypothetical protein SAMN05880582_1011529 [Rhizobium sp. RU20A]|nr:hypothetical protein [Rhizobium sp. RU20A]SIQ34032.1 hypothetical protein SAMN05880582_1011529 [Rhizobium sp. RU20A]